MIVAFLRASLVLSIVSTSLGVGPADGRASSERATGSEFQSSKVCITAAASLGGCLAAVSPASILTTIEESDCCTSLLAFKKAECYCLPPQDVDALSKADRWAYRRRISALRKVHERCGWEAFTCPGQRVSGSFLGLDVDTKSAEQVIPASALTALRTEADEVDLLSSTWQMGDSSDRGFRGRQWLSDRSDHSWLLSALPQGKQDLQISQLTGYMTSALNMASALSEAEDTQIEVSIEILVEAIQEDGDQQSRLPALREGLTPGNVWITLHVGLALSVLVLLASFLGLYSKQQKAAHEPEQAKLYGIVSAAEEARQPTQEPLLKLK